MRELFVFLFLYLTACASTTENRVPAQSRVSDQKNEITLKVVKQSGVYAKGYDRCFFSANKNPLPETRTFNSGIMLIKPGEPTTKVNQGFLFSFTEEELPLKPDWSTSKSYPVGSIVDRSYDGQKFTYVWVDRTNFSFRTQYEVVIDPYVQSLTYFHATVISTEGKKSEIICAE